MSVNLQSTNRRASMDRANKSYTNLDKVISSARGTLDPKSSLPRQLPHQLQRNLKHITNYDSYQSNRVNERVCQTARQDHFSFKPPGQFDNEEEEESNKRHTAQSQRSTAQKMKKPKRREGGSMQYIQPRDIDISGRGRNDEEEEESHVIEFNRGHDGMDEDDEDLQKVLNFNDREEGIIAENAKLKEEIGLISERLSMNTNLNHNIMKDYEQRLTDLEQQNKSLIRQVNEFPFTSEFLTSRLTERENRGGSDISSIENRTMGGSISQRLSGHTRSNGDSKLEVCF